MLKLKLVVVVCCISAQMVGQSTIDWEVLEINKLQEKTDTIRDITYDIPVFSEDQNELNGSKVKITGYLRIIRAQDPEAKPLYLLQRYKQSDYNDAYPLDALIEIDFKKIVDLNEVEGKSLVVGKLVLNSEDYLHPFYILKQAKLKQRRL